jgi:hypothetical protein
MVSSEDGYVTEKKYLLRRVFKVFVFSRATGNLTRLYLTCLWMFLLAYESEEASIFFGVFSRREFCRVQQGTWHVLI